jgi:3-methyladenine DNA glycosylase AlkD
MDEKDQGIAFAKRAKAKLKANADGGLATGMERYMRDQFPFFGIPAPIRKELLKPTYADWQELSLEAAWAAVEWWWMQKERECQYVAMDLIQRRQKEFRVGHLDLIESLIIRKSWWDTVDFLAANLAGPVLRRFPEKMVPVTSRWNKSDNLWLRRTSIIFQLKYREEVREDLLFGYCANCAHEQDFFIRKAIGWALRQYAKTKPERVMHFLSLHRLSPLSLKEAQKSMT